MKTNIMENEAIVEVKENFIAFAHTVEFVPQVRSLLGESVADADYIRLSNGTYSCSVCRSKPVFDTLQMLSVHRSGKRHMEEMFYRSEEQSRLQDLKRERIRANWKSQSESNLTNQNEAKQISGNAPLIDQTRKRTQILLTKPSDIIDTAKSAVMYPQLTKRMKEMDEARGEREKALQPQHLRRMKDSTQLHAHLEHSQARLLESMQSSKNVLLNDTDRRDVGVYTSVGLYIFNPHGEPKPLVANQHEFIAPEKTDGQEVEEKARLFSLYCDKMHQDGWIANPEGGWKRPSDGIAEFDSDEEPMAFDEFMRKRYSS